MVCAMSDSRPVRDGDDRLLVPVSVGDHRVYLAAEEFGASDAGGDEREIAARAPQLRDLLDGLAGFVEQFSGSLQRTDASKVTLEFGCEIAVESGSFVAIIGKVSGRSTLKVGLEWTRPPS